MRHVLRFISEAGTWAMASWVAALVFFGIALWEHAANNPVSVFIFVCLSVPIFWLGSVIVALKQYKRAEGLKSETERLRQRPEGPEIWLMWGGSQVLNDRTLGIANINGGTARNVQLDEMTDGQLVSDKSESIPLLTVGQTHWLKLNVRAVGEPAFGPFSEEALLIKAERPVTATVHHENANGAKYKTVFKIVPDRDAWNVHITQIERVRL